MTVLDREDQRTTALELKTRELEAGAINRNPEGDREVRAGGSGRRRVGARRPSSGTGGEARRPSTRSLKRGGFQGLGPEEDPGLPSPTHSESRRDFDFDELSDSEFLDNGDVGLKIRNFDD